MKANLLFEQLIAKQHLSPEQMQEVIRACISGEFNDSQIASFLALMRMKGETAEELSAAASVMQAQAHYLDLGPDLIDLVGTGGDKKNTFNVSTAASFVVAGLGIRVAKHGNRSVSSRSGSADVLEQAGFNLKLSDSAMRSCIEQCHLALLFAPNYHPAMLKVSQARQQLGIRTLFNLLGPMLNPARVKKQVVGVFSKDWLKPLSQVLVDLGSERHLLLSSDDFMDEISIAAATEILEYRQGTYTSWMVDPKQYGCWHDSLDGIIVNTPQESLELIRQVFAGKPSAARDMVVLNAAAAIYCATDLSFEQAIVQAQLSLDSGKAAACFQKLLHLTQSLGETN